LKAQIEAMRHQKVELNQKIAQLSKDAKRKDVKIKDLEFQKHYISNKFYKANDQMEQWKAKYNIMMLEKEVPAGSAKQPNYNNFFNKNAKPQAKIYPSQTERTSFFDTKDDIDLDDGYADLRKFI